MKKLVFILFMIPMLAFGQHHMMHILAKETGETESIYPTYVGSSEATIDNKTWPTDFTIEYTCEEGELLILCAMISLERTLSTPPGWTEFHVSKDSSTYLSTAYYFKRALSSESTSVTVSFGTQSGSTVNIYGGIVHRFSNSRQILNDYDEDVHITYDNYIDATSVNYQYSQTYQVLAGVIRDDVLISDWGDLTKLSEKIYNIGYGVNFFIAGRYVPAGFKLGTTVTLGETDYNSHKNILLSHLNPPYQ